MTTLHLTNCWHPRSGGIRTFYRAMFEAAEARGHRMRLVVPAGQTYLERVGQHGRIYHLQAPPAPFSPSYRILYPQRFLLPGSPVHRILCEEQPDLVEICDKFTLNYLGGLLRVGMLPGMKRRPAVVALSCERLDRTLSIYGRVPVSWHWLSRLYLRWLYFPLADHHIAVSAYVAEELRCVAHGHKVERGVWVGHMGVDASRFADASRQTPCRREVLRIVGGDDESIVLVYAGRLAPEKNITLLLETMAHIAGEPDGYRYRLLIVGDGGGKAGLMRHAESLAPGCVHFAAHEQDPGRLGMLLAACDLFVHPNPCEPFGIAPLEAMAAGVAVVLPDRGGVLSYANGTNAWLAAPNPLSFARAILDAASDPQSRETRIARARETAKAHSWEQAASRYLDLYAHLHALAQGAEDAHALQPAFYSTP